MGGESGSLSLTLGFDSSQSLLLGPWSSFLRGNPKSSDIWSLLSHLFTHHIPQAHIYSLPGMSLVFLPFSFSLPNLPYLVNLTPTVQPMSVSSCTKLPETAPFDLSAT